MTLLLLFSLKEKKHLILLWLCPISIVNFSNYFYLYLILSCLKKIKEVFIVVHGKEKKGKPIYQVSVVFKPGIMPCSPPIPPTPFTSDHSFTEWILTKGIQIKIFNPAFFNFFQIAINCEHAAMYAKELYDKQIKIRKCLLQTIKDVAEPYITNEKVTTE